MAKFGEYSPAGEFISVFSPEKPYHGNGRMGQGRYKVGDYGSQVNPRAAFAAMITLLDEQVGVIMAKVKELGLEENTLIIFSSDNGPIREAGADPNFFNSNGPLKGYKRDMYEGSIPVPMIAWWPSRIQAGTTSEHISAFWDVLPTACEMAGVEAPA